MITKKIISWSDPISFLKFQLKNSIKLAVEIHYREIPRDESYFLLVIARSYL